MKAKFSLLSLSILFLFYSCGKEEILEPGSISGITKSGGDALAGVTVTLSKSGDVFDEKVSSREGLFTFESVPPATYDLVASLAGYKDYTSTITLKEAEILDITADLIALKGDLMGTVTDVGGSAVANAGVALKKNNSIAFETQTNTSGSFAFEDVPSGEYDLVVTKERYEESVSSVEIGEQSEGEANVTLHALFGDIHGTVTNSETTAPLPGVKVSLKQGLDLVAEVTTDETGAYLIEDIDFGAYTAGFSLPLYESVEESMDHSAEEGTSLDVAITPQFAVMSGVVTDSLTSGALNEVKVTLLEGTTKLDSASSNADGEYSINIPFGDYSLRYQLTGYKTKTISVSATSSDPLTQNILMSPDVGSEITVNLYQPQSTGSEVKVPQLTIKNDDVQITAIGNNSGGAQTDITQVFISDKETNTEWMVLLDAQKKPTFFYSINSLTKEKEPYLYWLVSESASGSVIRFYEYDWENRLGTLQYEASVNGDDVDVVFDNETTSSGRSDKPMRSTPAPIYEFDRLSKGYGSSPARTNTESLDEWFDSQVNDLMDVLQKTKTDLINAPCKVSEILNKSDKNFVCKLSDALNDFTDEEFFNDFSHATEETQTDEGFEFNGLSINLDVEFFNDYNITENIERHYNDIRGRLDGFSLSDFFDDLVVTADVEEDDLDDLSDSNGVIHVGLSWNTATDIDLHVTDPSGEEIYFSHRTSASGGYLDLDDTNGYGPENIYFKDNVPDGTYKVELVYYGPSTGPSTNYTVKIINGLGSEKTYTGTITYTSKSKVLISNFTKSGSTLSF